MLVPTRSIVVAEFRTTPRRGETHNGDGGFVRLGAVCWLAVIDGLGHGDKAAQARAAAETSLQVSTTDTASIDAVMSALDAALFGSRGAGAMVCRVEGSRLEGCSVGNVELRCSAPNVGQILTPGILGRRVRNFRVFQSELPPSTRLMLFSDGIRRTATLSEVHRLAAREAARAIVSQHRDPEDDSTVLIADTGP